MSYVYGLLALAAAVAGYYIVSVRRQLKDTQSRLVVQKAISDNRAVRNKLLEAELKAQREARKESDEKEAEPARESLVAARDFLRNS